MSTKTIDGWLDGNIRPRAYHLVEIGDEMAPLEEGMNSRSVTGGLRLHCGLSEICAELANHIRWEAVVETAEAIVRFADRCHAGCVTSAIPRLTSRRRCSR